MCAGKLIKVLWIISNFSQEKAEMTRRTRHLWWVLFVKFESVAADRMRPTISYIAGVALQRGSNVLTFCPIERAACPYEATRGSHDSKKKKNNNNKVEWMTELKLTRRKAASGPVVMFYQLTSTDWNFVSSLTVYTAKRPRAERLNSLSDCLFECLSMVFFRYEPHIFSCWLSERVAPPFEFKCCSCSLDQIWRGALERKTHTHKHMCLEEVGCGGTGEVSTQMLGSWYCYASQHEVKIAPFTILFKNMFLLFLCLIVFQKKTKQIFNLILKQKENFFHSFQPFSFNHLPPFCYATPTFHYPVNSQMDKIHVSHWITSSLPRKKMRLHKWLATFG